MHIEALIILIIVQSIGIVGCQTLNDKAIVTSTGTVIGISGSQNAAGNSPAATIGYKRAEFAYVPIGENKVCDPPGTANCSTSLTTPNVLTELYFKSLLQTQLYQRLAIGDIAVKQGGAAIIFAKSTDGIIDANAAEAVQAAIFSPTGYGCEETCKLLTAYWKENATAGQTYNPTHAVNIKQCMSDNGLKTGAGRLAEFINLTKFLSLRQVCVAVLDLG